MKTRTYYILNILKIAALLSFALISLYTFLFSVLFIGGLIDSNFINIGYSENLLVDIRTHYIWEYLKMGILIISQYALYTYIWYITSNVLRSVNLSQPFTLKVAKTMEKISITLLFIWIISYTGDKVILHYKEEFLKFFFSTTEFKYLFSAGIMYIFSQIFKRGVEIQTENDLTV